MLATLALRDLARARTGLDIARRIVVERHGGAITIDSHPDGTVLQVRLPISLHEPESRTDADR